MRRPRRFLLIILGLIGCSPVIFFGFFCGWLIYVTTIQEFVFRNRIDFYPGAQEVSTAYSYYAADSGRRYLYYWTSDSIDAVQTYYEASGHEFAFDHRKTLFTVINADGSTPDLNGLNTWDACHYKQIFQCTILELVVIDNHANTLPYERGASSSMNATPFLAAPLQPGTLIIYSYSINDF